MKYIKNILKESIKNNQRTKEIAIMKLWKRIDMSWKH